MNHSRFSILTVFVALLLVGCTTPVQEDQGELPAFTPKISERAYSYPFGSPPAIADKMEWGSISDEAEREAAKEFSIRVGVSGMASGMALVEQFNKDAEESLEYAISEAQKSLAEHATSESYFMIAQTLGYNILDKYLAKGSISIDAPQTLAKRSVSPAEQATVAFATDLLASNWYPNADLMAATLIVVDDYWTMAKISETASLAKHSAEQYLERHNCEACAAKTSMPGRLADIEIGISSLDQFIQ